MSNPTHKAYEDTMKELAREVYVLAYHQALDDVAKALALPKDAGFLQVLRSQLASVQARALIKKVS